MYDGKLFIVLRFNCCWKYMLNKSLKGCEMICINIYICSQYYGIDSYLF